MVATGWKSRACSDHVSPPLALAMFLALACGRGPETPDWTKAGGPHLAISVAENESTCEKCLTVVPTLTIDERSGPGIVDESHYLAIDSGGKIVVSRSSGHQVYGPDGKFLRTIGRHGRGPLEFELAGPVIVDASGSVHFFDPATNRETIVDRDFALIEERPLPLGILYDAVSSPDGREHLLNSLLVDARKAGQPVHKTVSDSVVTSFGRPENRSIAPRSLALRRAIARNRSGQVITSHRFDYVLELFTPSGERLVKAKRTGAWRGNDEVPGPPSRGQPLAGYVQDIEVDTSGIVWVLSMDPRSDWERHARESVLPNGQKFLVPKDESPPWHRSRLEAIDLRRGAILTSRVFDLQLWGFLGPNRMYGYEYSESGDPRLVIFSIRFNPKA